MSAADERFQQALAWNIFRTLELVSPSFWLRRVQARLTGEPSLVAPQISRVHLWRNLALPPIQRVDGQQPDVVADVVIETEHAVWALILASPWHDSAASDKAAAFVDAAAWFAGVRQLQCGVIEPGDAVPSLGRVLQARYSRSTHSARLRSATRGPATPGHVGWGQIRWTELAVVLRDCSEGGTLTRIERALAGNALEWLASVGIDA